MVISLWYNSFMNILSKHPDHLEGWDYSKNKLDPNKVTIGSTKTAYWLCVKNHSYSRTIKNKPLYPCPVCTNRETLKGFNDLWTTHPDIARRLRDSDLGFRINHRYSKKVDWVCSKGHETSSSVSSKIRYGEDSCAVCSGATLQTGVNDIATTHPESIKLFLNPEDSQKYSVGSSVKLEFVCLKGHTYISRPHSVISLGAGCPYCSGHKVLKGFNDLWSTDPDVASKLVDSSEGSKVSRMSHKKLSWKCSEGHVWESQVSSVTRGHGCSICAGKVIIRGVNDLETTHPEVYSSLRDKNLNLSYGHSEVVEWVCENNEKHIWGARVYDRTRKDFPTGCPFCSPRISAPEYALLELLDELDPISQYKIEGYRGTPDIYIPSMNLIIEYDGCKYHHDTLEKDTRKTLELLSLGYGVIRIREQLPQYPMSNLDIEDPSLLQIQIKPLKSTKHIDEDLRRKIFGFR